MLGPRQSSRRQRHEKDSRCSCLLQLAALGTQCFVVICGHLWSRIPGSFCCCRESRVARCPCDHEVLSDTKVDVRGQYGSLERRQQGLDLQFHRGRICSCGQEGPMNVFVDSVRRKGATETAISTTFRRRATETFCHGPPDDHTPALSFALAVFVRGWCPRTIIFPSVVATLSLLS